MNMPGTATKFGKLPASSTLSDAAENLPASAITKIARSTLPELADDAEVPLVVDLDGTLVATDTLIESAFTFMAAQPLNTPHILVWLSRGRAALKKGLAEKAPLNAASLPYDDAVLGYIRCARAAGRPVYLASAADETIVRAVAEHLGLFAGWFASDGATNLSRHAKAERLASTFGEGGFDYVGNARADIPVWQVARRAVVAGGATNLVRTLEAREGSCEVLRKRTVGIRPWIKLLRPHQWVKNALIFVPLLTAYAFTPRAFLMAAAAFVSFSLCASSAYIVNDLNDVQADRQHPAKKKRPFAAGSVPVIAGPILAPALLAVAFGVALQISLRFVGVLAAYFVLTTAYSFVLKRKMLVDTITLASLYTIRVIGGAVAINVVTSQWLLGFSMFLFLSLALIKRYSEMAMRLDAGLPNPTNRNYRAEDLSVISSLAAAAGFSAVIVFSLYLASPTVATLYRQPMVLWLICPVLVYWISRMLMLSQRRVIDDDPVLFTAKDKISRLAGLVTLAIVVAARILP